MSISHSLSNALSGMTAASRLAEVVSSNLANALTDGYGRRQLDLNAAAVGGRGAGVEIGEITRFVDRGVLADRRIADADLSGATYLADMYTRVEDVVGSAGSGATISTRITALEASLIDASSDPSSDIRLGALSDRIAELATSLNDASDGIQALRVEADASIASQVDVLNQALKQVEQLNSDITYSKNTGNDPSALYDQRQKVIDKIAEIVPVRELDRSGGQVALMTPSGEMMIDGTAKQYGFTPSPVIVADMTYASGGLSGLTFDGAPIATDGLGKLAGGSLGAAFEARDVRLVAGQESLDAIAGNLIQRFETPTVDPTLSAGDPGLFTDGGAAYDPLDTIGLAGRISVNALVDQDSGGELWRLRDGLNAGAPGATGDPALLQAFSAALSSAEQMTVGGAYRSLSSHAANFESQIGSERLSVDSELSFATARWTSLSEAEAANGVDTDYEMQMLLRVEQAYAANARLVQTVESMLQTLMEI